MKAIVLSAKSPIHRPSLRRGFLLIPLVLACFGLAPMAQAVGPDTDGAIPGSNNGEGIGVLVNRTSGVWNTGTGFEALNHLTAGNQNTATGLRALTSDINGGFNTATGVFSLFSNTSGFFNCATGAYSLANNISGTHNTANGYAALYRNTADDNTATGFAALYHNTTGSDNTAVGTDALEFNVSAFTNAAVGTFAMQNNDSSGNETAVFNTAVGGFALQANVDGTQNTAVGAGALESANGGNNNTAVGEIAGLGITTHSNIIAIGSGVSGVDSALGEVDNACYIGNISGAPVSAATFAFVLVDASGKLGTVTVDANGNKVTIPGLPSLPGANLPQAVPQRVQPQAIGPDPKQAMLNRKVEELQATVARQQKQIDALSAGLQKVSAQLEVSKPALRMVLSNR
jgi:hypothetical protein